MKDTYCLDILLDAHNTLAIYYNTGTVRHDQPFGDGCLKNKFTFELFTGLFVRYGPSCGESSAVSPECAFRPTFRICTKG
jgi:hypothetical protein